MLSRRVLLELVEELAVVELEADVVRDAATQLRDLEEHPVGEAVGREDPVVGLELGAHRLDRLARPVLLEPGLVAEEERAGDGEERDGEADGDADVETAARLARVLALELAADRDREEDHAGEREPDDPADRVDAADEREREDGDVEEGQPAAARARRATTAIAARA